MHPEPIGRERSSWKTRHAIAMVALAPIPAAIIGSAFNIWYNVLNINDLLSETQRTRFLDSIFWFNLIVYPIGIAIWLRIVFVLRAAYNKCVSGDFSDRNLLDRGRRRAINLPWYGGLILGAGWFLCAPALLLGLQTAPGSIHPNVILHLPVSITIAGLITVTHGFFIVELASQKLLYPALFSNANPSDTKGVITLSLRRRGILCAIAASACPIVSLLLLRVAEGGGQTDWFAVAVGALGVAFGLTCSALLGHQVVEPVYALREASRKVSSGDLDIRVDLLRADEFGPLIDEFNHMVAEMREKEQLRQTFGVHVGEEAARHILERDPGLGGVEQEITVLFCDIRNYTARCSELSPEEVVSFLKLFFAGMLEIVERRPVLAGGGDSSTHQTSSGSASLTDGLGLGRKPGLVNQLLGDGFMALFGAGERTEKHAEAALAAALDMLAHMDDLNRQLEREGKDPIRIGIGIHTGRAVVGSIGSPNRMVYTAIGDTTNLASRVEGMTKVVGVPILFTRNTLEQLPGDLPIRALEPQPAKGQPRPIEIFTVDSENAPTRKRSEVTTPSGIESGPAEPVAEK